MCADWSLLKVLQVECCCCLLAHFGITYQLHYHSVYVKNLPSVELAYCSDGWHVYQNAHTSKPTGCSIVLTEFFNMKPHQVLIMCPIYVVLLHQCLKHIPECNIIILYIQSTNIWPSFSRSNVSFQRFTDLCMLVLYNIAEKLKQNVACSNSLIGHLDAYGPVARNHLRHSVHCWLLSFMFSRISCTTKWEGKC